MLKALLNDIYFLHHIYVYDRKFRIYCEIKINKNT